MGNVVLTVSPHPDDEVIGLGATLVLLLAQGWSMHNLACTLGRAADHERRRDELREAGDRLGFSTTVMEPPASIGRDDDLTAAAGQVADAVTEQVARHRP